MNDREVTLVNVGQLAAVPLDDHLAAIRDGGRDERAFDAVLELEITPVPADRADETTRVLRGYIERNCSASDERMLTATGAAIRSYVAILPASRLDEVAELLERVMHSELENEVAKMTLRKLTAVPPENDDSYPKMAEQLLSLIETYMKPRLLQKDCNGPVAMNSCHALAMMRSCHFKKICEMVEQLDPKFAWFRQQLGRRASRLALDQAKKFPAEKVSIQLANLKQLATIGQQ